MVFFAKWFSPARVSFNSKILLAAVIYCNVSLPAKPSDNGILNGDKNTSTLVSDVLGLVVVVYFAIFSVTRV